MAEKFIAPQYAKSAFHCPHCGVYADQQWSLVMATGRRDGTLLKTDSFYLDNIDGLAFSRCGHCKEISMWRDRSLVFPRSILADDPNEDLSEDIKKDYIEAATILQDSPRGAAALLRLCIQKLCKELGQKGKNLNEDIGKLVEQGLSINIKKAMDLLRVTGDNAVHPGVIDLRDDLEIATELFRLVNFIAEKMITEPKRISAFYEKVMPQGAKDAVVRRDKSEKNE